MSRHKTADLSGPYLDAAVAMAERLGNVSVQLRPFMIDPKGALRAVYVDDDGREQFVPGYSTDWGSGGYIIEREHISAYWRDGIFADGQPFGDACWVAGMNMQTELEGFTGEERAIVRLDNRMPGPAPLIAAMRAFVASRLGDDVDIPGYTP
jgi:hypothetical protein